MHEIKVFTSTFIPIFVLLLLFRLFRSLPLSIFLSGLRFFRTASTSSSGSINDKKQKKQSRVDREIQRQLNIVGAESMTFVRLTTHVCQGIPYSENFQYCVCAVIVVLLSLLLRVLTLALGLGDRELLLTFSFMAMSLMAFCQLKVDLKTEVRGVFARMYFFSFASIGFLVASALLLLLPAGILDFDAAAAAVDLGGILRKISEERLKTVPSIELDKHAVVTLVGAAAALLTSILLSPSLRFAACLYQAQTPPAWSHQYTAPHPLLMRIMTFSAAAPVLTVLLWVRPVTALWGLTPAHLQYLQPGALFLVALLQGISVKPLIQTFLNGSLLEWYRIKHGGSDDDSRATIIKYKCDIALAAIGKVALQLFCLVALTATCGAVLLAYSSAIRGLEAHPPFNILPALARTSPVLNSTASEVPVPNSDHTILEPRSQEDLVPGLDLNVDGAVSGDVACVNTEGTCESAALPETNAPEAIEGLEDDTAAPASQTVVPAARVAEIEATAPEPPVRYTFQHFVFSFLGWWSCLVWSVFVLFQMAVQRFGLAVS